MRSADTEEEKEGRRRRGRRRGSHDSEQEDQDKVGTHGVLVWREWSCSNACEMI
jgi:hypothetical protein